MIEWNLTSVSVGLLFGLLLALFFYQIADGLIENARSDDPSNEFIQSNGFEILMKLILPVSAIIGGGLLIGPIFNRAYSIFQENMELFGISGVSVYVITLLGMVITLNILVVVTRTPYVSWKIVANSSVFLIFGLLLPYLRN